MKMQHVISLQLHLIGSFSKLQFYQIIHVLETKETYFFIMLQGL
jgi:hypothetical protein